MFRTESVEGYQVTESPDFTRHYCNSNITAGVLELSFEKLLLIGLAAAIVLRPRSDVDPSAYCDAYPTYTYDSTYNLCYRSVKTPLLSAPDAEAACSADGPRAQLIRITDDHIYAFVLLQISKFLSLSSVSLSLPLYLSISPSISLPLPPLSLSLSLSLSLFLYGTNYKFFIFFSSKWL